jgi:YidC/Oxa1 family membrane protein insertase
MSDQQRMLLAAVLMAVVLFVSWTLSGGGGESDGGGQRQVRTSTTETVPSPEPAEEPSPADAASAAGSTGWDSLPEGAGTGAVEVVIMNAGGSDTLVTASVELCGGGISQWTLHRYRNLNGENRRRVDLAKAGLLQMTSEQGPVPFAHGGGGSVVVDGEPRTLRLEGPDGVWREYDFHPGRYDFEVSQGGPGSTGMTVAAGTLPVTEEDDSPGDYFKAVWMRAGDLEDEKTKDIEEPVERDEVDWAGVRTKYFTVLLMNTGEREDAVFGPREDGSPSVAVEVSEARVYAGPVDYRRLQRLGVEADRMVDFGWPIIRWIGKIIFWFISVPLSFIGNWGVRIIILTIVLKTMLWPLTTKSFTSMQKMKEVQPKLKKLQEKYKSDPKRQQMEMQKLYKEEGVNPLGGCFPLLLQMPFFFAMYRVLQNMVELRGADFVLWISDLSRPEILIPFGNSILGLEGIGLLALLMGVSMFIQQKMSVSDPSQKAMVYAMPVFMTWLFMRFPAGLTLYWFVNNLLTIGQQELIKKRLERA